MERTCSIRLVDFGSLKALVNVQVADLEIRGFKVIDEGNGKPWISPPAREIVREGRKEFYNIVRFPDREKRQEFDAWILQEYEKALNEG